MFDAITDIWLSLALLELSGEEIKNTAALTCGIEYAIKRYDNQCHMDQWIYEFRMAHSDHSTIRFDANYVSPQIWL